MRTSAAIRMGVFCALLLVLYIVLTHRISTSRIGVTKGAPYCQLSLASASASDIKVRVTVANPSDEPIGIPEWGLPTWSQVTTRLFEVDRDGFKIEYRGIMVKRDMQRGDMLQNGAGTKASVKISLASAGYDVKGHGKFTVRHRFVVFVGGRGVPCDSNSITVQK